MESILFINACVRKDRSRTLELAQYLLSHLTGEKTGTITGTVKELELDKMELYPLHEDTMEKRETLTAAGNYDDPMFDLAKEFAAADVIVAAAPYWEHTFPALLRIYFEQVSVVGLTEGFMDDGTPKALCKAKTCYYVSTAGGPFDEPDGGADLIRNMMGNMFHIPETIVFQAGNLDIEGNDVEKILAETKGEIDKKFA